MIGLSILVVSMCTTVPADGGALRLLCRSGWSDPIAAATCEKDKAAALTLRESGWSVEATCLPVVVVRGRRLEMSI